MDWEAMSDLEVDVLTDLLMEEILELDRWTKEKAELIEALYSKGIDEWTKRGY